MPTFGWAQHKPLSFSALSHEEGKKYKKSIKIVKLRIIAKWVMGQVIYFRWWWVVGEYVGVG
jgi:hypothetical protein